ncbi:hypothetical protein B5X24_HaOG211471 [Helicoverpa armigera]|nr:hypothetical protein B5X24_HaOG211471 [Helicoverpa armigera]
MVQCKKCKLFISLAKDDIVKCKGDCENVYHKKCATKKLLGTTLCDDCQPNKSSPKKCADDTKITLNPREESGENVLAEVNKKLEVIYNLEKKIGELTNTVEFYADMYQTLMEFKEESQKKIKALEQKNVYLEKCNKALEERIQELEVKDKEKNVEVHGLEKCENENTILVVQKMAQILNLDPNDIQDAQRVGQEKPDDTKPKTVLVTLRSKSARNSWLLVKKERKITNNKVYENGSEKQIYINEDLPKHKRQLLWTVRNKLKPKGFQYIWVQNGNILVKKNSDEKKIHNIRSEVDLNKETSRGGGILIYAKNGLEFDAKIVNTEAVETLHGQLKHGKNKTHIIAIYRPPAKSKLLCIQQLENLVRSIPVSDNVIIIGDTNINLINNLNNPSVTRYKNALCACGLLCAIPSEEPTREAIADGRLEISCLDHIWVRARRSERDACAYVLESRIADHHGIGVMLNLCVSEIENKSVRNISSMREVLIDKIVKQKLDKITEKIIVGQISEFLEQHNILCDTQHGFRKGRNTVSALLGFSDYINECLDTGKQIIALFIDYKKAFDTLDHEILLQAMDECGIRGPTNAWFKNYLTNRKISTVVSSVVGKEANVDLGVPTGSVYGPVGYIIHVNSVSNVVQKCKVFMYADDMCLVYASKDISEVQRCIQDDFENHPLGPYMCISDRKAIHSGEGTEL